MESKDRPRIEVNRQFQRSIQLDADLGRADALSGYICQPSARNALSIVARHIIESQQRAFTWTGPFGGGKSTLALALAQLAGGQPAVRQRAKQALLVENGDEIWKVFGSRKPWLILPVVGRRQAAEEAIGQAIDKHAAQRGPKPMRGGRRDVVAELLRRAESPEYGGVLLMLDELGKLFEAAAAAGEDIYLFQELAEAASRSDGKLVIVGVLHQAFEQYAARSARETQAEWAKVQGRFADIPLVAGTDEVIELIGGAIHSDEQHAASAPIAKRVALAIRARRPASPPTLADSLDRCWPLHPITAALLGPSSRRRFGQNERSVFGFLNSSEPLGFREFLAGQSRRAMEYYDPARFWDYLRVNFEPAILASADGHRWATSAEAIERVEARFREPHVSLVKTIGLIELFRNGSGLAASSDVLEQCVAGHSQQAVASALDELAIASILIFRKHLQAWGIYAGSDFDIDAAVDTVRREQVIPLEDQLKHLSVLAPVTARKHYSETGTLRWFERVVTTPEQAASLVAHVGHEATSGRFVLLIPSVDVSNTDIEHLAQSLAKESNPLDLFGAPRGHHRLAEFASELAALEHVATFNTALEGDSVARREITARLDQLRGDLEGSLREAFTHASWYSGDHRFKPKLEEGLSPIASQVCDRVFDQAPHVFSELVNRDGMSSNAVKAQRLLMHRMISHGAKPELGYDGFPADAGLYFTTVAALGLHRVVAGQARFMSPDRLKDPVARSLIPLWRQLRSRLETAGGAVSLADLYELASQRPFGVKRGMLPILLLAFLLVHRSEIAMYIDNVFMSEFSDADVDEWLQDPSRVSWKWVRMDTDAKHLLTKLAERLEMVVKRPVAADPLDSARALVALAIGLPVWTQRTAHLSEPARQVLTLLLRATDPVKVIFADLPEVLGTRGDTTRLVAGVGTIVEELQAAYPQVLERLGAQLLTSIDHGGPLPGLQARATVIQGISGDFKLDAFVTRLTTYAGTHADIESLVSLAVNKPPRDFNDHDIDLATMQLARWAFEFRRTEAMAIVQGRPANRRALAVVFAGRDMRSATLDVSEKDAVKIGQLRDDLLARVRTSGVRSDVFLAALAEAGSIMLDEIRKEQMDHG
jgi:hypothetical protein